MKKIVLAYSGGLDTSYCLKKFSNEGFEVHAISVNTGGFTEKELAEIEKNSDCDGFIIGCFDDTGLTEARSITTKPIIGIGQSAFHMAALRHGRFCVLTTLEVSVPIIEQNIKAQGFGNLCKDVINA